MVACLLQSTVIPHAIGERDPKMSSVTELGDFVLRRRPDNVCTQVSFAAALPHLDRTEFRSDFIHTWRNGLDIFPNAAAADAALDLLTVLRHLQRVAFLRACVRPRRRYHGMDFLSRTTTRQRQFLLIPFLLRSPFISSHLPRATSQTAHRSSLEADLYSMQRPASAAEQLIFRPDRLPAIQIQCKRFPDDCSTCFSGSLPRGQTEVQQSVLPETRA